MAKKSDLWGVYIRRFDGYENVWDLYIGPFVGKARADQQASRLRKEKPVSEFIAMRFK